MPRLRDQHAVWTIAAIALAAFFISAALAAPSAAAPLVPCGSSGQPACSSICQVFDLGKNVFDFIVYVSFSLAVLMIAWGGVLMIVPTIGGGESTKMYAKGRGILWKAFMGLVLIMVAWLAIDSLIKLLAGQSIAGGNVAQIGGYGPWNTLKCDLATPLVTGTVTGTGTTPQPGTCNNNGTCESGENNTSCPSDCPPSPCSVQPPSPLTDPLAQQMEGGQTVIWTNTHPILQCSAAQIGGSVTSAYRPQSYQTHLYEIHSRWCNNQTTLNTAECTDVKNQLSAEMSKHALNCSYPVASSVSSHGSGRAVDISGGNPNGSPCLYRPFSNDPVHYEIKSTCQSRTSC